MDAVKEKMAVAVRDFCGALVEGATFELCISEKDHHSLPNLCYKSYKIKKEFYEVYTPFYTDSQVQRMLRDFQKDFKSSHSSNFEEETSAQKKRRKRKPPILTDKEEKISKLLEEVLPNLIQQGKECHLFIEADKETIQSHDNNRASRLSALCLGCGDLFQELCMQSEKNLQRMERAVIMLNKSFSSKNHYSSNFINNLVENSEDIGVQVTVDNHLFLIPARSRFLMSSFSLLVSEFCGLIKVPGGYDLIVLDPPWNNKSVKRKKSYHTFDETEMCSLPVHLLSKAGGLMCVWVTNNERILSYVKDVLFRTWNVKWLADWFWMKVTQYGEPVCDIRSSHKKPYERLVIGRIEDINFVTSDVCTPNERITENLKMKNNSDEIENILVYPPIPRDYILVSVPCSLHSKKPPLSDILSPYLPFHPMCLEMFARNLLPGWTSWGNEVLRHQHSDYYDVVS